jgi:isopentenyl diphosphate isomerase/L-lactate dehydrogenase-like FMN-dependent dehydrogenase
VTRPSDEPANVAAYEALARERLPSAVHDYYAGGAEDELTLRLNRAAFTRWAFRPRVLADVSRVDTSLTLLGSELNLPVLLAPTAFQRLAHPDGELATARAAALAGTILVASTLSTTTVEQTAAACPTALWFQLYVYRDRELSRALIERAAACGCRALCLTVTVPVAGNRERDARNAFRLPPGLAMANFEGHVQALMPETAGSGLDAFIAGNFDASLDWRALEWLRSVSSLPIVVKGVMTGEDAALAVEHGAAAVIVSNHGGRQLDGAAPTLLALRDVVDGAAARVPVLMDGGVRRGSDVVKALCLGATAVLIGRPYLWGLAVGGQAGVERVLALLDAEIRRTLALLGRPTLASLGEDALLDLAPHGLA